MEGHAQRFLYKNCPHHFHTLVAFKVEITCNQKFLLFFWFFSVFCFVFLEIPSYQQLFYFLGPRISSEEQWRRHELLDHNQFAAARPAVE